MSLQAGLYLSKDFYTSQGQCMCIEHMQLLSVWLHLHKLSFALMTWAKFLTFISAVYKYRHGPYRPDARPLRGVDNFLEVGGA